MPDISPAYWARVEELFLQASALPDGEQSEFLKNACRGDKELQRYVLKLLRANPAVDQTIQQTIADTIVTAFDTDNMPDQMRGEMIGPYRVERLLGAGGMGMVYLAERDDEQFDQQVAIKLGRHRLVDPDTVARLRTERQILADLDHANIARLFDGGTTSDGVPYLVMEYIDGVRIDTYCDIHQLNVDERLQLFLTICSAVHYAHQNLVIHRDIKASNILVTTDGVPKLLDFGIAKLIDTSGKHTDGLTREGAVILTPANATPEQVQGQPVTTATDVYALGLLLYALLTGFRTYDSDGLTPAEFAQLVSQQDALKPSTRILNEARAAAAADTASLETVARDRRTTPARLEKELRGDLDTIILKALRKDPRRRYESVSALADDIRLHLREMPITARSESWRYRAGKFVRRHTAAVAAAAAVVAMLAAFTVALSLQNRQIAMERDIAQQERDTAQAVSSFLEDIFKSQDPEEAQGVRVTAEELLASGVQRIDNLGERPEIQSTLMETIGRAYQNLGDFRASATALEESLRTRIRLHGEADPRVAETRNDLAATLIQLADYARAEALLTSALATNEKLGGEALPELGDNLINLANLYVRRGDIDQAESMARRGVQVYSGLEDRFGDQQAAAKATLARILQTTGDLDTAEALFLEALQDIERAAGKDHQSTAYYLQNLGALQRSKGDLEAARATLDRAVDATRRILGDKHHVLAATLADQGAVFHQMGDFDNANNSFVEALDLYREVQGQRHPSVGYTLILLGMLQHDRGDLTAAESSLRESLSIFEVAFDRDHQYTASALTELGAVLNSADKPAAAEALLMRALDIRLNDYASDHELVAATRTELADALTRQGHYDAAETMLIESLAALRDSSGRRQRRAGEALARLQALSHPVAEQGATDGP